MEESKVDKSIQEVKPEGVVKEEVVVDNREEIEKQISKLELEKRDKIDELKKQHVIKKVGEGSFILEHYHCVKCGGVFVKRSGDLVCPSCKNESEDFPSVVVIKNE